MNKIYKVVWSKVKNCYVVVSEIAKNVISGSIKSAKIGSTPVTKGLALGAMMAFVITGNVWAANMDDQTKANVIDNTTTSYVVDGAITAVGSDIVVSGNKDATVLTVTGGDVTSYYRDAQSEGWHVGIGGDFRATENESVTIENIKQLNATGEYFAVSAGSDTLNLDKPVGKVYINDTVGETVLSEVPWAIFAGGENALVQIGSPDISIDAVFTDSNPHTDGQGNPVVLGVGTNAGGKIILGSEVDKNDKLTIKSDFRGIYGSGSSSIEVLSDNVVLKAKQEDGVRSNGGHLSFGSEDNALKNISIETGGNAVITAGSNGSIGIYGENVSIKTENGVAVYGYANAPITIVGEEKLDIKGNIRTDRTNAIVNINTGINDALVTIEGDIRNNERGGSVVVTLGAEGSYLKGKITDTKGGVTLNMNEGTTWEVMDASHVGTLNADNATFVVDVNKLDANSKAFTVTNSNITGTTTLKGKGLDLSGGAAQALSNSASQLQGTVDGVGEVVYATETIDSALRGDVKLEDGKLTTTMDTDNLVIAGDVQATTFNGIEIEDALDGKANLADVGAALAGKVDNNATGQNAIAMGFDAKATDNDSVALGWGADATSFAATAIGREAVASGQSSNAIGENASAVGTYGNAIGYNASAGASSANAIGANAKATGGNSIAIGSVDDSNMEATQASAQYAIAIGSSAKATKLNATAVGHAAKAGYNSVAIGANSLSDDGSNDSGTVAIGLDAKATGNSSVALGRSASASTNSSVALGTQANADGVRSVAVGYQAKATGLGDVAIGVNSATTEAVNTTSKTIGGVVYNFAGNGNDGILSAASVGGLTTSSTMGASDDNPKTIYRQLQYVAAGQVSETSTDAVNGSQLYAAYDAIDELNETKANTSDVTTALAGKVDKDASQVLIGNNVYDGEVNDSFNHSVVIGEYASSGKVYAMYARNNVVIGYSAAAMDTSSAVVLGQQAKVDGAGQGIAIGAEAKATASKGIAMGFRASVTGENSVALGANSVADRNNTVSVGKADGERQITNVAAGTEATDAVNVGQLKATNQNVEVLSGKVDVIESDYLKSTDKTELSEAISAEKTRAEGIEEGLRTDVDAIKGDYLKSADKSELSNAIGENTTAIGNLQATDATNLQAAKDYADGKVNDLANGAVKTNTEAIANNKSAIDAINDAETGIFAQAEAVAIAKADEAKEVAIAEAAADATAKANQALADAKTYADSVGEKAAQDATAKANQALADAKTYADGVVAKVAGDVSELGQAITNEVNDRIANDEALSSMISAEANRAAQAEKGLGEAINAETARAQGVEGQLSEAITNEVNDRIANDAALSNMITAEAERAAQAEAGLGAAINAETARAQGVEGQLSEAITNETAARIAGDEANAQAISGLNQCLGKLNGKVNKVGAGAAALAALHPLEYDPDDKLTFSAGVGNYAGENAAALGAFYRPNEKFMVSLGGTMGNGENMVNLGVSIGLDKPNGYAKMSKRELIQEVNAVKAENEAMKDKLENADERIAKLEALVAKLVNK